MTSTYAVILVDSTSHALRIEKLLIQHGYACKLIPVPRHLSSDCGVCVRILAPDLGRISNLLESHRIIAQSIESL